EAVEESGARAARRQRARPPSRGGVKGDGDAWRVLPSGPGPGSFLVENHVRAAEAVLLPVLDEQTAVGVEDEIGGAAAERARHLVDAFFAAFNLDEGADRRFIERDRDVRGGELFAVFLVPEPHV